ncbi:hypothetical protein AYI69_g2426 [Smittium culicis]|uniref:Uncharacterized protein n=1 Tax=Smittium culicis TaxID=133412 RepID=A0A1R1YMG2_9FUNG|nr:hypothetical protein AYI69_g2426 [Smittium culicis]
MYYGCGVDFVVVEMASDFEAIVYITCEFSILVIIHVKKVIRSNADPNYVVFNLFLIEFSIKMPNKKVNLCLVIHYIDNFISSFVNIAVVACRPDLCIVQNGIVCKICSILIPYWSVCCSFSVEQIFIITVVILAA